MAPTLKDIFDTLDRMAPFSIAQDWDNSGLQIGTFSKEIKKIFISLDPSLKALQEASRRQAQLLLTHHPLIFGYDDRIKLEMPEFLTKGDDICTFIVIFDGAEDPRDVPDYDTS